MVRVISSQDRQLAQESSRRNRTRLEKINRELSRVNSPATRRGVKNLNQKAKLKRYLIQTLSLREEIRGEIKRADEFSQTPTFEEARRYQEERIKSASRVARKSIERGIPTNLLTGMARTMVKNFREDREALATQTQEVIRSIQTPPQSNFETKVVSFNATSPPSTNRSSFNSTILNSTGASLSNKNNLFFKIRQKGEFFGI